MNDPDLYNETATFCKLNDDKRPTEVFQIGGSLTIACPLDPSEGVPEVEDAIPTGWYVRLVFDELLDPTIEELIPNRDSEGNETGTFSGTIATTQPVTLTCGGVTIPYDGYYNPGGNYQTWPLGPSLVIQPDDPSAVPTGAECEVTINANVVDKSGTAVPADQRGPYRFSIAGFGLESSTPRATAPTAATRPEIVPDSPLTLSFNAPIDPATVTSADVQLFRTGPNCTGGTQVAPASVVVYQAENDDGDVDDALSIQIADGSATGAATDPADPADAGNRFEPNTTYRVEFMGAAVSDVAGGAGTIDLGTNAAGDALILCFTVSDAT